jgi:hypothetical protein
VFHDWGDVFQAWPRDPLDLPRDRSRGAVKVLRVLTSWLGEAVVYLVEGNRIRRRRLRQSMYSNAQTCVGE